MKTQVDDILARTEEILQDSDAPLRSRQVRALAQALVEDMNRRFEEVEYMLSKKQNREEQ